MKKLAKLTKLFNKNKPLSDYRLDIPLLQRYVNNKPIVYFDNACMSLRPKPIIEQSNLYYYNFPGCMGRSNHLIATEVKEAVDEARATIAKFFGAETQAVVFTKNCTEALNLVANAFPFQKDDVVLTTDKEHNSNLIPWLKLQQEGKIKHDYVTSTPTNEFSLEEFEKKLQQHKGKVKLVSMVLTSNLDGVTLPAKEIVKLAHKYKAKVLFDCAQAATHQELNIKKLKADFLTVSAHKMYGPNGIGALISTLPNLKTFSQFIVGGETVTNSNLDGDYTPEEIPERFEGGLQNYPGIIGFAEAVKYIKEVGISRIQEHIILLNEKATVELGLIPGVHILGPKEAEKRSGILSFIIDGKNIHEVSLLLNNLSNVMVRSGVHCVYGWFNQPQNASSKFKDGTIRASFSFYNTLEEVEIFIEAIRNIVNLK